MARTCPRTDQPDVVFDMFNADGASAYGQTMSSVDTNRCFLNCVKIFVMVMKSYWQLDTGNE